MKLLKKPANDMSIYTCDTCNAPMAKIDGRTLEDPVKQKKKDKWAAACPKCNVDDLVYDSIPKPFLCHDRVMRTKEDLDLSTNLYKSKDWAFAGFAFSKSALYSSIELIQLEGLSKKEEVEKWRASLARNPDNNSFLEFSKAVCTWGGGPRVWANLDLVKRKKTGALAQKLCDWFQKVEETSDAEEAISPGTAINGLGVSFASKHLRMLNPEKFAVLDSVLRDGLGFALNIKGYKFFMQILREFQSKHELEKYNIATLESGIFRLVRQQVRTRQSKDISGYPII